MNIYAYDNDYENDSVIDKHFMFILFVRNQSF